MAIRINKQELASTIRNLQELTDEQKSALLELLHEKKQYGLVWENHEEDVEEQLREQLPVLKEVPERRILSEDKDAPNHILIEGDNLHALTSLCYTHEGKIDVIYIDPPYNTGNKDFVYNDSYVDAEDGYRHSKWLSFMDKRLRIAKRLLSDDGAIFVSIDENELYPLKVLCDEIFFEKNFIGQWNWYKSATPPALSLKLKRNVEYILCYEKSRSSIRYQGVQKTSGSNDPITKPQNTVKDLVFPAFTLNIKFSDCTIKKGVYGTAKFPNELLNDLIVKNGVNQNEVTFRNKFIWLQSTLDEEIKKGTRFDASKQLVISYKRTSYSPEVPPNFIDMSVGVETNEEAGKQLIEIIGNGMFDYPKPVSLIKYLLKFKSNPTILDFFAGSGTTLHATMQLNAEDGGHRQCILVTNNENNICEEVTYERNKRVINGYTKPNGDFVEGLHDNNLRYYKTEFVSRENSSANRKALMSMTTDLLCIKENLYDEVPFEIDGKKMKPQFVRCFESDDKIMIIIYDPRAVDVIARALPEKDVKQRLIYVYSDGQYAYNDEFKGKDVELCALPDAIYQALNRVMPRQKEIKL